ncbi:MAG TPA: DUF1232 domain-containing protein [Actinomycetota bacterium]|nr:DUF1232 domain-containing protein [Actinomycetota bacterium]
MSDVAIAVLIVVAVWVIALGALFIMGRTIAAKRLLTLVPNLVTLFRGLLGDDGVPLGSKLLLGGALLWIVSPVDLVPEFVPVLGPLDDAIVGALVLRHVVRRAGPDVVARHWRGDAKTLAVLLRVAGVRRWRNDSPLPA